MQIAEAAPSNPRSLCQPADSPRPAPNPALQCCTPAHADAAACTPLQRLSLASTQEVLAPLTRLVDHRQRCLTPCNPLLQGSGGRMYSFQNLPAPLSNSQLLLPVQWLAWAGPRTNMPCHVCMHAFHCAGPSLSSPCRLVLMAHKVRTAQCVLQALAFVDAHRGQPAQIGQAERPLALEGGPLAGWHSYHKHPISCTVYPTSYNKSYIIYCTPFIISANL